MFFLPLSKLKEYIERNILGRGKSLPSAIPSILKSAQSIQDLDDEHFLEFCYESLLGRKSDPDSRYHYEQKLRQGVSRLDIINLITSSNEFRLKRVNREFVPSGHFYSCVPSEDDIAYAKSVIDFSLKGIAGIQLNEAEQLALLETFKTFYQTLPFQSGKSEKFRFHYDNPAYSYPDSIFLHCFIRYLKPKKIIEVGSGYSSCMMLDTNEYFFDNSIDCTFIEPYPQLLKSLLKSGDFERITIVGARLQEVDSSIFSSLDAGDILFIDSTHVGKAGSDVNKLFFEVLPLIKKGVFIHIHDIFYPLEYPDRWLEAGRAWNEQYILRAFLQYNNVFKIRLFVDFIVRFHRDWLGANMSDCLKNTGGSIWLEKLDCL
ncbi:MAG: DUF4214 domain-containing protein [Cyanobacteria bacterium P01_G01_bin.38]